MVFDTHGLDTSLNARTGQNVTIIRELTSKECDIEDVGRMYRIKFDDGYETDAFEDELILTYAHKQKGERYANRRTKKSVVNGSNQAIR